MNQKKERTELDLFFDNLANKWLEFSWPEKIQVAGHLSHSHERSEGSGHQFPLVVVITKATFLPPKSTQALLELPYDLEVLKYQLFHLFCNNRRIKGSSYCG